MQLPTVLCRGSPPGYLLQSGVEEEAYRDWNRWPDYRTLIESEDMSFDEEMPTVPLRPRWRAHPTLVGGTNSPLDEENANLLLRLAPGRQTTICRSNLPSDGACAALQDPFPSVRNFLRALD